MKTNTVSPVKRLTADPEKLLALTDSLNPSAPLLRLLNQAISNPRVTIETIAPLIRRDVVLSAKLMRTANAAFFKTSRTCDSIERALHHVGLREVARLIATATMQGEAPSQLCAYGITDERFQTSVRFAATASQLIACEVKLDPQVAYLSALMRPLGVLVLNQWAERQGLPHGRHEGGASESLLGWEQAHFGLNHVEVSSLVLRRWGFPSAICDGIEKSIQLFDLDGKPPLALVLETAETLAESNRITLHTQRSGAGLCKNRLDALGLRPVQLLPISRSALLHARN